MAKRDLERLKNVAAEKSVIGAILRSEHAFWQVEDILRADMFTYRPYQMIFAAVRDICTEGKKPTRKMVESRLPEEDDEGQSYAARIAVLMADAEDVESPLDFAPDIAAMASRRAIIATSEAAIKSAYDLDASPTDLAAEMANSLNDIAQTATPDRPVRISELVQKQIHASDNARQNDVLPGYGTGIAAMDALIGRLMPGEMGAIVASSGDGKTALAMQIAEYVSLHAPVLVFSKEMTKEAVALRTLAGESGVSSRSIRLGEFTFAERDALLAAGQAIEQKNLYLFDKPGLSIRQIKAICQSFKRKHGLVLAVLDQLDKIRPDGRVKDKWERYEDVTSGAKNMFKELMISGIMLAQRTVTAQRSSDPVPSENDCEAKTLRNDCDWYVGLWSDFGFERQNRPDPRAGVEAMTNWQTRVAVARSSGMCHLVSLKDRSGETRVIKDLKFIGHKTRFVEV